MNLAEFSFRRKTTVYVITILLFLGGLASFQNLGRLEDPEFTIKQAVVFTRYPGATAYQVEQEVTERLEEAIQAMGQRYEIRSLSKPGLSIIYAEMQDKYDKETLPQVWDELRRKVGDAQGQLPPGAGPSVVNDDYGDVYGVFLAITGDGYSYAEMLEYAKTLKRELLVVRDVAKIAFWGAIEETVYVELSRSKMSQLGISPQQAFATLGQQNAVNNSGRFKVGDEYIRFNPTGEFKSVKEMEDLLIRGGPSESLVYLKDIATIRRGFQEPPTQILHYNGKSAIGLGISTISGGNVVVMGEAVRQRLSELENRRPVGMELGVISFQSDDVTKAIQGFNINLLEAVLIVLVVLWVFMGWRSAVLIGGVLLITIVSTFVFMGIYGITLQRISLGALIIALGMLVDNAIVVTEGILIGSQTGLSKKEAAIKTVKETSWPLLGATVVAILAFAAIGVSQDSSGEFCRALFQVILFSLLLSWVFAVTVTPLIADSLLKSSPSEAGGDPYAGALYQRYRKILEFCVDRRWLTLIIVGFLFLASLIGFGYVDQSFFPESTRAQFYVDFWLPEGTHIRETESQVQQLAEWIRNLEGVTSTATFVGGGALRFMLTYTPEDVNNAFGHVIITVDDYRIIDRLGSRIVEHIKSDYPDAIGWYKKFVVGPGLATKVEARFRGPDADVLRKLESEAEGIFREDPDAIDISTDWRQRVKVMRPVYSETAARLAGVSRPDLSSALLMSYDGIPVGLYREEDDLLPIIARAPEIEREEIDNVRSLQVWASATNHAVPLEQVVTGIETVMEDQIISRVNRMRAIKARCNPVPGTTAEALRQRLDARIREEIALPTGYQLDWAGEYEKQQRANKALNSKIPPTFLFMVLVVILLFDRLKQPAIIYLTLPLALIGVTVGLLVTRQPFGFMALLGFLSLSGMLIKNAIVLIDATDGNIREGMDRYESVILAGVSRMRPVMMAALTTMLGMLPLFQDAFFVAMAVTIVFGLGFATFLTLLVVPTLYSIFFGIRRGES
jgi:multidrug efflux pump subunit AcrB